MDEDKKDVAFCLKRVNFLSEKLERCRLECEEEEKLNEELTSKYQALKLDLALGTKDLKLSLAEKGQKVEELKKEVQAVKEETETLKLQRGQEIQRLQQQVDELAAVKMKTMQVAECEQPPLPSFEESQLKRLRYLEQQKRLEQLDSENEKLEATVQCLLGEIRESDSMVTGETQIEKAKRPEISQKKAVKWYDEHKAIIMEQAPCLQEEVQVRTEEHMEYCTESNNLKRSIQKAIQEEKELKEKYQQLREEEHKCGVRYKNTLATLNQLRRELASARKVFDQQTAAANQLEMDLQWEKNRSSDIKEAAQDSMTIIEHILQNLEQKHVRLKKDRLVEIIDSVSCKKRFPPATVQLRGAVRNRPPPKKDVSSTPIGSGPAAIGSLCPSLSGNI